MRALKWFYDLWGRGRAEPAPKAAAKKRKRREPRVSHAAEIRRGLLNATAEALGSAPEKLDSKRPKAVIKFNGSCYTIQNTVGALTVFQDRLEKLPTVIKQTGVPRAARKLPVFSST